MQIQLLTYADVVAHALDYIGATTDLQSERFARRAVQMAVNDFHSKRNWAIFYKRGRIHTQPMYQTGTITYLLSSGSVPREVTLSGGTWPTWAGEGNIIINQVSYPIAARISGTVLQLQQALAPNADLASPLSYQLAQESYPLPVDFGDCGEITNIGRAGIMQYQTPDEFVTMQRILTGPAIPWAYTIQGDSRRYGSLAVSFYPAPDLLYEMDYSYRRQSRALSSHGTSPVVAYVDGSATIAATSLIATGINTAWTRSMVGAVIRFAATSTSKTPTGQSGTHPFFVQRTITGWTSATSITMDQVPGEDLLGVPYAISDPVDLEAGAMTTYFLREVEAQMRLIRRIEPTKEENLKYREALIAAFEADARHHEQRASGQSGVNRVRIANLPIGQTFGV